MLSITRSAVNKLLIGVGQTWKDVKASRSLGVTYTNTTGKPILINLSIDIDSFDEARAYVDGIEVARCFENVTAGANPVFPISFIVPNESIYSANIQSGSPVIFTWAELS